MTLDFQAGISILIVNFKFNTLKYVNIDYIFIKLKLLFIVSSNLSEWSSSLQESIDYDSVLIMTRSSWDSLANSISNEMQRTST